MRHLSLVLLALTCAGTVVPFPFYWDNLNAFQGNPAPP